MTRAWLSCALALLVAVGGACSSDEVDGTASSTTAADDPTSTMTEMTDVGPDDPGDGPGGEAFSQVEVRAVLSVGTADDAPDGAVPDGDGAAYALGEALADGAVVGAEAVVAGDGRWSVALVLAEGSPGIDDLNDLAARCEALDPTCPTGQVAVVADGAVLAAPVLVGGPFARDEVLVSGLDQTEARRLAAALG